MGEWRVRAAASRSRAARAFCVAIVLAGAARAHLPAPPPPASHDDILRVQLWDAEGLSEHPSQTGAVRAERPSRRRTSLDELHRDLFAVDDGSEPGRFVRHRVRHKRRRARDERGGAPLDAADTDPELSWSFHGGSAPTIMTYVSGEEPPDFDEGEPGADNTAGLIEITGAPAARGVDISPGSADGVGSAVSSVWSASLSGVNGEAGPPMTLRQDIDDIENAEESEKKTVAVVPKCCPSGQNLTAHLVDGKRVCQPSLLTFQPLFYEYNDTFMWEYESNLFETIVGNPCVSDRYKLNPEHDSRDEFYLTVNGTMFAPFHAQPFLSPREYCMETFYSEGRPAGVTLPLVCFLAPPVTASQPSATLVAYALGLILSVPFLVATACAYTLIPELRDTHGLALACHSACLAVAFSCLAATQLAGHAFPERVCTAMAFVIQFSFVSCFFWLNVMCFDIWLNVRHHLTARSSKRSERRRFVWYAAYAALLPLALLVVTLVMDLHPAVPSTYLKPNFGVKGCWFKTEEAALPYFYGPVACILLANLLIFFLTSRAFALQYDKLNNLTVTELTHPEFSTSEDWVRLSETLDRSLQAQAQAQAQMQAYAQPEGDAGAATPPPAAPHERHASFKSRWKKYRKIFRTCLLLSCIMGISWVMEVVSWAVGAGASEALTVWSIFDVVNALQGLVIFAIFILQAPVRGLVWRRLSAKCSKLCSSSKNNDSEMEVVSERTIIDFESSRKRVYV